jgi:pSer/pThr/pTyr-binding forkhead associated (FHA) protein
VIDHATDTQTTGALPELTERERRRAVADTPAAAGRFLAMEHRGEVVHLPLGERICRIGRGIASDVTVEDPAVSRRHALVVWRGGEHVLLDDRSRNGTFLNGERVAEAVLHDGDEIVVGTVAIRFVDTGGPATATGPPGPSPA